MGKVKYENLGMNYPLKDTREATKGEACHEKSIILLLTKKEKPKLVLNSEHNFSCIFLCFVLE